MDWFRPLPKATTWRGTGQSWTITHGFFVQMGGFMLYDNGYPKEVLSYARLVELLNDKVINAPTVTERDLPDRSKGDTISKAIIVLQMAWFAIQCMARIGKPLPLSEWEVLTLAFAVMDAAIYVVWLKKPQGVKMSVPIPLKTIQKEVGISTALSTSQDLCDLEDLSHPEPTSLSQSDNWPSEDNQPLIRPLDTDQQTDEHFEESSTWFRRTVRKDYENNSLLYFVFVRLPYRILLFVPRLASKMVTPYNPTRNVKLRVPMFCFMVDKGRGRR